jgi:hypothetical protein
MHTICNAWLLDCLQDPNPSVATLLPDAASGAAAGMAQRLGKQQLRGRAHRCMTGAYLDVTRRCGASLPHNISAAAGRLQALEHLLAACMLNLAQCNHSAGMTLLGYLSPHHTRLLSVCCPARALRLCLHAPWRLQRGERGGQWCAPATCLPTQRCCRWACIHKR